MRSVTRRSIFGFAPSGTFFDVADAGMLENDPDFAISDAAANGLEGGTTFFLRFGTFFLGSVFTELPVPFTAQVPVTRSVAGVEDDPPHPPPPPPPEEDELLEEPPDAICFDVTVKVAVTPQALTVAEAVQSEADDDVSLT